MDAVSPQRAAWRAEVERFARARPAAVLFDGDRTLLDVFSGKALDLDWARVAGVEERRDAGGGVVGHAGGVLPGEALEERAARAVIEGRGHAGLVQLTATTVTSTAPAGRTTTAVSPSRRPSRARPSGASTLMSPRATSNSSGPTSR